MLKEQQTLTNGQAARELGITASWLRFGERLGALPLTRRNERGWRFYTPENLDRLRRIGVGERKHRLEHGDE